MAKVISVLPSATPVAIPSEDIVAILVLELFQVTGVVIIETTPLEKVPTATNRRTEPTVKSSGEAGDIEIEDNIATGNFTAGLVVPDSAAVMSVLPSLIPVATPFEDIVATSGAELTQVTLSVISVLEPSELTAVAVSFSVRPTAKLAGVAGVISMDDNVKAITVKLTNGLVISDKAAVILILPIAAAVATPAEEIVAIFVSELVQVTLEVISAVEPSTYVPVATNTCVEPTPKISGVAGVIAMDDKAGAGTTVKVTAGLVVPERVAVMLVFPTAMPVATPAEDIVAILVSELIHATLEVMSAFEPSA